MLEIWGIVLIICAIAGIIGGIDGFLHPENYEELDDK